MSLKEALSNWGAYAVRCNRRVLIAAVLLAAIAAPFAVRALRHIDVNLFNQASNDLKRFQLMRALAETFGGDMLLGVVTIPDEHSLSDVEDLKNFAQLLAVELSNAGRSKEDQAELSPRLRSEIAAITAAQSVSQIPLPPVLPADPSGANLAPDSPDSQPTAWLRNVECRVGQTVVSALKTIARQPYVLLDAADVERLKALFEPAQLNVRMEQIETLARELAPLSAEKKNYMKIRLAFSILESKRLKNV